MILDSASARPTRALAVLGLALTTVAGTPSVATGGPLPFPGPRYRAGAYGGTHDDVEGRLSGYIEANVELAREGDREAFARLYEHYVGRVYSYTFARTGDRTLAEDATSETFLRAMRSIGGFRWQGADFGAWLVTVARHVLADHFRSSRFRLEASVADVIDYTGDLTAASAEDVVMARATAQQALQALQTLPADQQECLYLRHVLDLSVAETACALGRSQGAVRVLAHRGLGTLARRLDEAAEVSA